MRLSIRPGFPPKFCNLSTMLTLDSATAHYFGFPKTKALRVQFLLECWADLRKNMTKQGLILLNQQWKPEDILLSLAKAFRAQIVYAQKEACSEELNVERSVIRGLQRAVTPYEESTGVIISNNHPKLQFIWSTTMYHLDDLPFVATCLADVYTQFHKALYFSWHLYVDIYIYIFLIRNGFCCYLCLLLNSENVEAKDTVRTCIKLPVSLGPRPLIEDWRCLH